MAVVGLIAALALAFHGVSSKTIGTTEVHNKTVRERLANLEDQEMRGISESLNNNQRILKDVQRIVNKLDRPDTLCRSNEVFYNSNTGDCGSCYIFDFVLRSWSEARSYCRSQGGDLVSIETHGENGFLKRTILENKRNPLVTGQLTRRDWWFGFWTSGSDRASEGNWVWLATGSALTITDWYTPQPDNHAGNEHYLLIRAEDGQWNDGHGPGGLSSICERIRVC